MISSLSLFAFLFEFFFYSIWIEKYFKIILFNWSIVTIVLLIFILFYLEILFPQYLNFLYHFLKLIIIALHVVLFQSWNFKYNDIYFFILQNGKLMDSRNKRNILPINIYSDLLHFLFQKITEQLFKVCFSTVDIQKNLFLFMYLF